MADDYSAIGMIYATAIGDHSWQDLVSSLSNTFHDARIMLCQGVPGDLARDLVAHTYDLAPLSASDFTMRDGFDPAVNACTRFVDRVAPGTSAALCRFADPRRYRREPFWEQVMTPQHVVSPQIFVLARTPCHVAGGSISVDGAEMPPDLVGRFDRLLPHLVRAMHLRHDLARLAAAEAAWAAALDDLSLAVLAVDADLRIRAGNRTADAMLAEADGLRTSGRRLRLAGAASQRALEDVVARLAAPASGQREGRRVVAVPRPSGRHAYRMTLLAGMPGRSFGSVPGIVTAIVSDPEAGAAPDAGFVRAAYGLTSMEATVATLIPAGLRRPEIAARLGLSENTVRSHLKAVYDKLGVRSQAELVRVLMR
jgi:DNA-binding CsgD family transcriptional regulator